jgi:hypothetical protein
MAGITWGAEDDDDPYSSVTTVIRLALEKGFIHKGEMSEGEYANLKDIEEFVRAKDNA